MNREDHEKNLGLRFNFITITGVKKHQCGGYNYTYICDCGYKGEAYASNIISGKTKSCGCKRKKLIGAATRKHGKSKHPLYKIWIFMKMRCTRKDRPRSEDYANRGIGICQEWESDFESFYKFALSNGWKCGLQIDRIDNDGSYSPDNCRFVTPSVNSSNKRNSRRWVVGGVEYRTAKIAGAAVGVSASAIRRRCGVVPRNNGKLKCDAGYASYLKYGGGV